MSAGSREKLVQTLERLMSTQGLARIGTRDIARSGKFAEGTLYKHFKGKDDLVIEVLERNLPGLREALRDLPLKLGLGTVQENLQHVAYAALKYSGQMAPLICSLFADVALLRKTREKLQRMRIGPDRSFEVLTAYISAEQRLGRVSGKIDAEAASILLFDTIFGLVVFDAFVGRRTSALHQRRRIDQIVATLLAGLEPRTSE
ncbi:MAG: TetR/AcrR family transcriptional regulator [Candidatus Binataceae bacterium]